MTHKKCRSLRQNINYRLRAISLLFLIALGLFPTATYAQETEAVNGSEVTILSQTETPEGIHTTMTVSVRKDSFLSSLQPNTNFGSAQLRLGWSNGDFNALRLLIEFDISAIPPNSVINNATLSIFQTQVTPAGDRNMDFRAQFMRSPWDERAVTWNNANYLGGDALPLGTVGSSTGLQTADVSNLVRTWYSGSRPNNGLIVIGDETPANNRWRQFGSRESGGAAPFITIDFTTVCDTIAPNVSVNALPAFSPGTFRVGWSGTDSAPSGCTPSGIANYDVDYRINGSSWHNWKNQTTSTANDFRNWANNGDFVEFRGRATDFAGNVQPMGNPQTSTRIDTQPPTVAVTPLPPTTISQSFNLVWTGNDNLSGVANYDVQWRENGGDWRMLVEQTPQTIYAITGAQSGVTYDFRIRGTDNVGNSGEWPDSPQASTLVAPGGTATVLPFTPNILESTAPVTTSFTVNWEATVGAPIASFEIFVQFNNSEWRLWQNFPANQRSAQFPFPSFGFGDGFYGFEAVAITTTGQRENRTLTPEAVMAVNLDGTIQISRLPYVITSQNALVAENAEDQGE